MICACLITRSGVIHVIDHKEKDGTMITWCGNAFDLLSGVNTIALDSTNEYICNDCISLQEILSAWFFKGRDEMFQRSKSYLSLIHKSKHTRHNKKNPQFIYNKCIAKKNKK